MPQANPGYHTLHVGDIEVTALNDGQFLGSVDYLVGIAPADAEAQLRASLRAVPPMFTVNCFLVRTGANLALIDTGAAQLMGPTLGKLPDRLAAIGVAPGDIDTVLLTHLHGDHVGGLADAGGTALFPNATVMMPAAESAFWLNEANAAKAPEAAKSSFAVANGMTAPYRDRTKLITEGEALPGVSIVPLPGHTPGHSGWLISSGDDSLLIWGDIVHIPGLQFARPEAGLAFDVDAAQARATRERAFDMAASDKLMVAGMHLEFPAFGHVVRNGAGYAFAPAHWMAE